MTRLCAAREYCACCGWATTEEMASSLLPFSRSSLRAGSFLRLGKECSRLWASETFFRFLKPSTDCGQCTCKQSLSDWLPRPVSPHCSMWLCDRIKVSRTGFRFGLRPSKMAIRFRAAMSALRLCKPSRPASLVPLCG